MKKKRRKSSRRKRSRSVASPMRRRRRRRKNPSAFRQARSINAAKSRRRKKSRKARRARPRRRNPEMGSIALGIGGLLTAGLLAGIVNKFGESVQFIKNNPQGINILVGTVGTIATAAVGRNSSSNTTKASAASLAAGMGLYTGLAALKWLFTTLKVDPAVSRFAGLSPSAAAGSLPAAGGLDIAAQQALAAEARRLVEKAEQASQQPQEAGSLAVLTPEEQARVEFARASGLLGWNPPYPGYPAYNDPRMPWLSTMAGRSAASRAGYSVGNFANKAGYSAPAVSGYYNLAPSMGGYYNLAPSMGGYANFKPSMGGYDNMM